MSNLEPWQERLIEEEKELASKLEKLTEFMKTDQFAMLYGVDQDLLELQLFHMKKYSAVLSERIERINQDF
jgi:hypothetical protein